MNDKKLKITIKTLYGLEEVVQKELKEFGFQDSILLNRAVQVEGSWKDVYFLNLHLRCALSVLVEISQFKIKNEDELYKKALKIDWTKYFQVNKTFAVKGAINSTFFKHTQFPFLLLKDAIVDTFREKVNERPDVQVKRPQVLFDLYVNNDLVTISLNTSGQPLYFRGYRQSSGKAPLNEVLAAGLIQLSGWDKKSPLFDPFCGSGTILTEAALMAANLPSCIERQHFAFKNFANYDATIWEEIISKVDRQVRKLSVKIFGGDISSEMVLKARRNLRMTPVGRFVEVKSASFEEWKEMDMENGVMLTNPPYGERMGEDIAELYTNIGDWMKGELKGCSCWVISSNKEAMKSVGLKADKRMKLFNGKLECTFRKYSIYAGSKKEKYSGE